MSSLQKLRNLKALNLDNSDVSLAIVKEYKRDRVSHYVIKYVLIDERLENRLKNIMKSHIRHSNAVEEYTYDCPEPEADLVRAIDYEETDFFRISEQLLALNPEENIIENEAELVKAKGYLIVVRNVDGIQLVGFKTLPENWKMKRDKGLIPLLFENNRFVDLESDSVFSISSYIDLIYYDETLFILSKREFERGMNFRDGMINNAEVMYAEVEELNLFINIQILKDKVGNNQRYLRKIATIRNLGHYRNPAFIARMQEVINQKGWNVQFQDGQIVFSDETLDDILTLLQNKRLHSELTYEDFDVDSVKPLN